VAVIGAAIAGSRSAAEFRHHDYHRVFAGHRVSQKAPSDCEKSRSYICDLFAYCLHLRDG
jgi:hypothetical protein